MRTEQTNYIEIDNMINVVYKNCWDEYPKNDKSLDAALKIFKKIKDFERIGENDEADYDMELRYAKNDLHFVFDMSMEEINKLTKNNLYMMHQSKMVNAIYMMLNKGYKGGF